MTVPPSQPEGSGPESLRVLVTGGAGFIGSHLVRALLERGDDVLVIDNLSTGARDNLEPFLAADHPRLRLLEQGLSAALETLDPGEPFDEIYHLAAAVGVKRVVDDPCGTIETNVLETIALLRFVCDSAARGPIPPRTLIASTSEIYGKGLHSPFAEGDDCVYGPTTARRWCYACSKAIDEHLALAHHDQHGIPVVIVRLFNTVGPRQRGDYGMVLPSFVQRAIAGEPLEVYGDGTQTRCFCDVRDVVPALIRLLADPRSDGEIFNLGSDHSISVWDLAGLVIETLGSPSARARVPYDEAYSPGFEDLRQRQPELSRVKSAIDFDPVVPLRQTILDIAADLGAADPAREGLWSRSS